jgi:hypothetical protein
MMRLLALFSALAPACLLSAMPSLAEPRMAPPAVSAPLDPSETSAVPEDGATAAQRAHQQRMRACAIEWHGRKRAGKTEGQTWKAFNAGCMKH